MNLQLFKVMFESVSVKQGNL